MGAISSFPVLRAKTSLLPGKSQSKVIVDCNSLSKWTDVVWQIFLRHTVMLFGAADPYLKPQHCPHPLSEKRQTWTGGLQSSAVYDSPDQNRQNRLERGNQRLNTQPLRKPVNFSVQVEKKWWDSFHSGHFARKQVSKHVGQDLTVRRSGSRGATSALWKVVPDRAMYGSHGKFPPRPYLGLSLMTFREPLLQYTTAPKLGFVFLSLSSRRPWRN